MVIEYDEVLPIFQSKFWQKTTATIEKTKTDVVSPKLKYIKEIENK